MRHIASRAARALFAPALIALAAASPAAAQEMDVKIGFYPGGTFMLPHFVAEAKGYYKDAGLTVTSIPVANGPLMNTPAFAKAFGCKPGDPMVRPPELIPQIW